MSNDESVSAEFTADLPSVLLNGSVNDSLYDVSVNTTNDNNYTADLAEIISRIPSQYGKYISCDSGWNMILSETNKRLRYLCSDYEILQVKEKFGLLCFYWKLPESENSTSVSDPVLKLRASIMRDIVEYAEYRSAFSCECCGKSGKLRERDYWLKTLCFTCAESKGFETDEWERNFYKTSTLPTTVEVKSDNSSV